MHNRPSMPYGTTSTKAALAALGFLAAIIGMTAIAAVCVYVFGKIVGII